MIHSTVSNSIVFIVLQLFNDSLRTKSFIHLPSLFFSLRLLYDLSITLLALTFHGFISMLT